MSWGESEKKTWFQQQSIKRSYLDEVVTKIKRLNAAFEVEQYGALTQGEQYPLFLLKSRSWAPGKRTALITGGVHGYETSGVHGALSFMENAAPSLENSFNFVCAPCISPWAYETINRWNAEAVDPNRSFYNNSPAQECQLFLDAMASLRTSIDVHIDLHETTDTDNTVFRPALEARDGVIQELWDIPDGFYLVGDSQKPAPAFQKAIIDSVRKITHIAPTDHSGRIIGVPIEQEGVINYDVKPLFLCSGFSDAPFCTTTEVYPDSPLVTDVVCEKAQVAAIIGGLQYLRDVETP